MQTESGIAVVKGSGGGGWGTVKSCLMGTLLQGGKVLETDDHMGCTTV